ncbi:hypothetical protein B0H17DRAFT_1142971 [Mycena rosella]|uniref:Uncharacterized protein n=1 Tax=Mycena rosella TaxID=1033263 RepID=A0AAD7G4J7_MYCRO|nr:hypothetical protein B0H17DRAFT_1142971 [Mycena rosella]
MPAGLFSESLDEERLVWALRRRDCLRDLWEKAVSIGFNYGEENLACAREEGFNEGKEAGFKGVESGRGMTEASEAAVLHEGALEAERVWGYDVGWKFCCKLQKSRTLQASPIPPFPCSLSIAATQTDNIAVTSVVPAAVPAPAPAPAPVPAPLDWAENAATLPIFPSCFAALPSACRLHAISPCFVQARCSCSQACSTAVDAIHNLQLCSSAIPSIDLRKNPSFIMQLPKNPQHRIRIHHHHPILSLLRICSRHPTNQLCGSRSIGTKTLAFMT